MLNLLILFTMLNFNFPVLNYYQGFEDEEQNEQSNPYELYLNQIGDTHNIIIVDDNFEGTSATSFADLANNIPVKSLTEAKNLMTSLNINKGKILHVSSSDTYTNFLFLNTTSKLTIYVAKEFDVPINVGESELEIYGLQNSSLTYWVYGNKDVQVYNFETVSLAETGKVK